MKYLVTVLLAVFAFSVDAQITDVRSKKDSCYFRFITAQTKTADGKDTIERRRMKPDEIRYAKWECGDELGVVDCNNDLSYEESSNTVFKKQTDISRVAGANKPFTGTCQSCYRNGRKERRVVFVNGKENGSDTTYYESGCPQIIRTMVQGVESGKQTFQYDSTEMLAWEENYYMGQKEGRQLYFSKPGKYGTDKVISDTMKLENFKNGIPHGVKKVYYRRGSDGVGGSLKREVTYKDGIFEGDFKIYNLDRVVIEHLNYKDGKKDQECNYYYDDGKLLKTESWKDGIKNGEFKMFYYQGHIQKSENYKKGKKEGWFEEFFPDQTTRRRTLYKKDVLVEDHKYDEHGRETYSYGTPDSPDTEDDEMPTTKKKKKKKR